MNKRMTDERLAALWDARAKPEIWKFWDARATIWELLQAMKAERQHAGLLDDSRLGAERRIKELEGK